STTRRSCRRSCATCWPRATRVFWRAPVRSGCWRTCSWPRAGRRASSPSRGCCCAACCGLRRRQRGPKQRLCLRWWLRTRTRCRPTRGCRRWRRTPRRPRPQTWRAPECPRLRWRCWPTARRARGCQPPTPHAFGARWPCASLRSAAGAMRWAWRWCALWRRPWAPMRAAAWRAALAAALRRQRARRTCARWPARCLRCWRLAASAMAICAPCAMRWLRASLRCGRARWTTARCCTPPRWPLPRARQARRRRCCRWLRASAWCAASWPRRARRRLPTAWRCSTACGRLRRSRPAPARASCSGGCLPATRGCGATRAHGRSAPRLCCGRAALGACGCWRGSRTSWPRAVRRPSARRSSGRQGRRWPCACAACAWRWARASAPRTSPTAPRSSWPTPLCRPPRTPPPCVPCAAAPTGRLVWGRRS
ncbi:hypothetical protein LPJ66_011975, partial [Kickxella alabastrina]